MTYRALEERKVDLAIARMFKPVADEQMDAEVLYNEQEVVVAGAEEFMDPAAQDRSCRIDA